MSCFMAISPARCWSKACRETGVQVLPCIFWASLMKPWSICSERMLACVTELAATHQHHQAINKGVWRETCAGPVPLDPSTAQPAKNSPGRKEKHLGKTSLLGSCVGPCHRGGKQKATLSESGVFGQKTLDLASKRGSSHQAQAGKSLLGSVLSAQDSLSGVDREKNINKGMQTLLL